MEIISQFFFHHVIPCSSRFLRFEAYFRFEAFLKICRNVQGTIIIQNKIVFYKIISQFASLKHRYDLKAMLGTLTDDIERIIFWFHKSLLQLQFYMFDGTSYIMIITRTVMSRHTKIDDAMLLT